MSDDMIMLLIRIAVIVFPTGIACFMAGFMWGRSTAYNEMNEWEPKAPPALDVPDVIEEAQTIVTKRNRKVML